MASTGEQVIHCFSPFSLTAGISTVTALALDAVNDGVAFIFMAPPGGPTLTHALIRTGAKTGTPGTYTLSLQGVDMATGFPDGTVKGGASPVSVDMTLSASDQYAFAFDNAYNSSPSEWLALCITPKSGSGTFDGSNNWTFMYRFGGVAGVPYSVITQAGTPTRSQYASGWAVGDGTTWWGLECLKTSVVYVTVGSSPVMAGSLFTIPAGLGDTVTLRGLMYYCGSPLDVDFKLYDGATDTLLATASIDQQFVVSGWAAAYFDGATLTCGTPYRLVMAGVSTTPRLYYCEVAEAAYWDAIPWGQTVQWTQGDVGSWAETATRRALLHPIITGITELSAPALTDPPA